MSLDIKYIKDTEGNNYFPVVHEKGVVDDNGTTLESKLQSKQDAIGDIDTIRNKANSAIQSITVGTTTTGAAGSSASVTNTGTATAPILSFTIPQGAQGIQGPQGPQGIQGPQGDPGESGVTGDVSEFTVHHTIDTATTYGETDIAGATAVQNVKEELRENIVVKNSYVDTTVNILTGKTAVNGWPGSNPGWASNSNNYKGYFITVAEGDKFRIKANASRNTVVAMLPNDSHTQGTVPNKLASYTIAAKTIMDVEVPSGATCMWVDALYNGNSTAPQYVYAFADQYIKDVISNYDELNSYIYDGIEELSVGQLYEEGQNVKTSESEVLKVIKEVNKLTVNNTIDADTYWVYNGHTYKAAFPVNNYDSAITYNDGDLAFGSPTEIFFTVTAETPTEGNIDITVGTNSATVAITSESTVSEIAESIITGIGTIDGWNWTNNEDGSFKLTKSTVGSSTLTVTFTDTGSTGVLLTNSSVAGTAKVAIYSNGQWAAATLASIVTSNMFIEQTVNDLYELCQKTTLNNDLIEKWVISPRSINYKTGQYYDSLGKFKSNANYGYIDEYIPISPYNSYSFSSGVTNSTAYLCEYTSAKAYKANRKLDAVPKTFSATSTSYYLRVSFPLSQVENVWLKDSLGNIIWQAITPANIADAAIFDSRITPLEESLSESEVETKVITTFTSSRLIMANSNNENFGNVVSVDNADYAVSPFIDISGYNKFSVSTLTSSAQAGAGTVLYNANKEPLVGYYKNAAPSSFTVSAIIPEEVAYIRITHWSGTFSAGNVKLRLWDELKEFTIRKTAELDNRLTVLESSDGIPSGLTQYEYIGEKISFVPKFALTTYMSLSLTGTGQGGASYGDYYFVGVGGNGTLNVFNLATKTKLAAISLAAVDITNAHANTITFSNQYHTDGDEFPILYICSGYALNNNTKMYGYRIVKETVNDTETWSATLVHTITLAGSTWTDAVIDNGRQKLWIKKSGGWYCVDMPQYSNGDATIDLSIATPEFSYPSYEGSGQGHFFYNDKIYFSSGIPGTENVSKLYVLNTKTGKYDSIINLLPILGTSHEPENVFVYNGYLYVASRHSVFKMYFD